MIGPQRLRESHWRVSAGGACTLAPCLGQDAGESRRGDQGGAACEGLRSRGRHSIFDIKGELHATTAGGDELGWQCVGGWLFVAVAEAAAGAGGVERGRWLALRSDARPQGGRAARVRAWV